MHSDRPTGRNRMRPNDSEFCCTARQLTSEAHPPGNPCQQQFLVRPPAAGTEQPDRSHRRWGIPSIVDAVPSMLSRGVRRTHPESDPGPRAMDQYDASPNNPNWLEGWGPRQGNEPHTTPPSPALKMLGVRTRQTSDCVVFETRPNPRSGPRYSKTCQVFQAV